MKRTALYIIMCLVVALTATAQMAFRTSELQRLATTLRIDTSRLHDGYNYLSVDNQPLTVHLQNNELDHIGLSLFSEEMRQMSQTPVFDFLERYFLQLKYPPSEKTAAEMIRDDAFRFERGSLRTIGTLLPTDNFEYHTDGHRYVASWSRNDNPLLVVSFPVEYQLLSGKTKIDAENHILSDIRQTAIVHTPDNMETQQNDHYIVESCTNRIYFVGKRLVASSRYPAETVANMMLSTEMKGSVMLRLTQVEYGFRKSTAEVDLKQWITFCRNTHCQLFFGVDNIADDGTVEAVVLAVNREENYNHVLTVTVPADVIAAQQGTVEARLYSYVPTQNVRNLFGAYQKSNPKTFVTK